MSRMRRKRRGPGIGQKIVNTGKSKQKYISAFSLSLYSPGQNCPRFESMHFDLFLWFAQIISAPTVPRGKVFGHSTGKKRLPGCKTHPKVFKAYLVLSWDPFMNTGMQLCYVESSSTLCPRLMEEIQTASQKLCR